VNPQPILGAHYTMPGLSDVERILVVSDGTFTYQLAFLIHPNSMIFGVGRDFSARRTLRRRVG
jgi:hypothetical protein